MRNHVLPSFPLCVLCVLCGSFPLCLVAEEDKNEPRAVSAADLESRRKALERWALEPLAIETSAYRLLLDRHDGSFVLRDRRSGVKLFSSWRHRGFASVRLADQRELPVDRVEELEVEEKRIRFRGASTAGELPPLSFELSSPPDVDLLEMRFEVPEESRGKITRVRLLDDALWVADADGGGVAVGRENGEWYEASRDGALDIRLTRLAPFATASGEAYSLPLVALLKGEAAFLLFWETPSAVVEVQRRRLEDGSFPGRGGIFVSLEFSAERGEARLVPLGAHRLGVVDAARAYRELVAERIEASSLRYKTALLSESGPPARALIGAVFFRPLLTEPPRPPLARGEVRYTFEEVAEIAERWRSDLEIDQAAFLLDGWVGSGAGERSDLLAPADECGGRSGLEECARRLRKVGYLLGLTVDRDQLVRAPESLKPSRESAWRAALEGARSEEGFAALKALCSPPILVIRTPEASEPGREGKAFPGAALLEARAELARYVTDTFGLYGAAPGSELDIPSAAYLEGLLTPKLRQPTSPELFPLFGAVYGHSARLASARDAALGAGDAAGFLAHLIYGEAPAYRLPSHVYFRQESEEIGDDPERCFARAAGWTAGKELTPLDVFIKNTFEVCSHVARTRAREVLLSHRFLTADGSVQETYFGQDLRIVVNFGREPYDDEESGCLLPRYGFAVRHPFFYAFHALRANDLEYDRPAFFTVRSLGSKMYLRAEKTRIYHGFGPTRIRLGGRTFDVEREAVVRVR